MRPVDKGESPYNTIKKYQDALPYLGEKIGYYCSYCEFPIKHVPEVEHVVSKSKGGDITDWMNLLLGCKYCNARKSANTTPENDDDFLWPDVNNTAIAYTYENGYPKVNEQLLMELDPTGELKEKATNTYELVKLGNVPDLSKGDKDRRLIERNTAYYKAKESLDGWLHMKDAPDSYREDLKKQIIMTALGDGFYSVWMTVFANESQILLALTEGFESTDEVVSIYRDYGWNNDCLTSEEYTQVLNHLANANEEQADALGFFFTLLLYSNILPEDILKYQDAKSLFEVMAIGVKNLLIKYPDHRSVRKYPILSPTDWAREDRAEYDKIVSYTPGFHEMSEISHENEKLYLWEVIYELNKARNFLKCRPWKQTQVMTKEIDFQESLVKSFYLYMGFLAMNGFTPCGLFSLFFKKQRLNLWRQNTNY